MALAPPGDSPIHNPAFVVENRGDRGATLQIDGKTIPRGPAFRRGHIRRVNRYDPVVWIRKKATEPVQLSLGPEATPHHSPID